MPPRAIFFDMDDTLLDTSGRLEESWTIVCDDAARALDCEAPFLREIFRREFEEFWRDEAAVEHWRVRLNEARVHVVTLALQRAGLDTSVAQRISDGLEHERKGRQELFHDAIETLEWLRDRGFRLALITNGPAAMQRDKLARFPLEPYFDTVIIEGVFGAGKPDPRVFQHALEVTGAKPHEAWHVGDNLYADIGGAQKAGVHGVWIHRDRLELRDDHPTRPDRVIAHLHELREALGPPG